MVIVRAPLEDFLNMSLRSVSSAPGLKEFYCNEMSEGFYFILFLISVIFKGIWQ